MDDLTQSWNHFTLSKREGPLCLSVEVLAQTFTPLWRARNGFKIQNIGNHRILFTFDNKDDVDRIISSKPWSFDKHLVVM